MNDRASDRIAGPDPLRAAAQGRVALVVLGMHRTGTSALAGALHRLGAAAPRDRQAPRAFNAKGNWESRLVVRLNDRILKAGGSAWQDWSPFDADRIAPQDRAAFQAEIIEVVATEFGDAPLILLKDPRMCRLMPFWLDALRGADTDPRIILPVRHPLEAARSLLKRDGTPIQAGMLLWLRHMLDAEEFTRGTPRCFVSFDDFLADWRPAVARMSVALQVAWPVTPKDAALDEFLDRGLRHQGGSPGDTEYAVALEWVTACNDILSDAAATGQLQVSQQERLDAIRHAFDPVSRVLSPLYLRALLDAEALEVQRDRAASDLVRARMALHEAKAEIREIRDSLPRWVVATSGKLRKRVARWLGRRPGSDGREAQLAALIVASGLFDPAWYLEIYADVRAGGMDPALHFLRVGAAEGRNPSASFSTVAYQQRYPDVAAAGTNPLVHFLETGIGEGRVFDPVGEADLQQRRRRRSEKARR